MPSWENREFSVGQTANHDNCYEKLKSCLRCSKVAVFLGFFLLLGGLSLSEDVERTAQRCDDHIMLLNIKMT